MDTSRHPRTSTPAQPSLLALGAAAAFGGFALQAVASAWHPSSAPPNDSVAAFHEYAHSQAWVLVHLGQFAGALLIALALVVIARSIPPYGLPGALAIVGGTVATVWAAIFGVQMAVDGFALKFAIDAWHAAPAADQPAAFLVAESVRAVEKGLSSLFHLTNGAALLSLGLAISIGGAYPRWIGWFGATAGIGYLAGGVAVAHTGFSAEASGILSSALLPGVVFLFGAAVTMAWRSVGRGDRTRSARVAGAVV
jgi:hypothetical protein